MGQAKASLTLGGESLLARTLRILRAADLRPLAAAVAPGQVLPPLPDEVVVVRDGVAGQGPLQGLADGLDRLAGREAGVVFVAACDLPLLSPAFVRAVLSMLGRDRGVVPMDLEGRPHPLAAAYRVELVPEIRDQLAAGERRVRSLLRLPGVRPLAAHCLEKVDPGLRSLTNVNRPEDLAALASILGSDDPTRDR